MEIVALSPTLNLRFHRLSLARGDHPSSNASFSSRVFVFKHSFSSKPQSSGAAYLVTHVQYLLTTLQGKRRPLFLHSAISEPVPIALYAPIRKWCALALCISRFASPDYLFLFMHLVLSVSFSPSWYSLNRGYSIHK